jgi:hypothetical protein
VRAHELVEDGRRHVARGRVREAMACFTRAADDPEQGAEALSLLAAAYLLPGALLQPELALAHAHRAVRHPAAGREHLTRCAMVALSAGDPAFADELASRARASAVAGADTDDLGDPTSNADAAVAIGALAKLRQEDRPGLRALLSRARRASGPAVYWRRLVIETATRGWLREALAARRAMRRGGLPAPDLAGVLIRSVPPPLYVVALAGAAAVAMASHDRPLCAAALVLLLGVTALSVRTDLADGRIASARAGMAWMVLATIASVLVWR